MCNKKTIISLILFLLVYLMISIHFETPATNQLVSHQETNDRFLKIEGEYEKGQVLIKYQLDTTMTLAFGKSEQNLLDQKLKDAGIVNYVKLGQVNQSIGVAHLSNGKPQPQWIRAYIDKELSVIDVLANLGGIPQVISAEPNYMYFTTSEGNPEIVEDPLVSEQYYLNSVAINEARAHLESLGINGGGSRDVVVAVIDTGVDYTHQDLAPNMWVNTAEIPGNGIDDDGNGFVDDIYGASTVSNTWFHTGNPMDDHGHGTHVAGIIAGRGGNGVGIRGVADNVRIMAIKASASSGIFLASDIAEAVAYAYQNGADVINMSFGGYAKSNAVEDALAIAFSRAVLIAAAGNDAYINRPHQVGRNMYPAAYPWVVGVMASSGNTLAGFSNFDYWPEDAHEYSITAPGTFIMSTLPNNRYAKWSGTSMAAPIVSGIAALLRSKFTEEHHNSRFIMGQLIGTATQPIHIPDYYKFAYRLGWDYYYQVSAINALTQTPKPNITFYDYFVFDSETIDSSNNGNGVIDSGELIYFGLYIRNHWGQAKNVEVKLNTTGPGGVDDPYVTFINDTVNYGKVGSFSTADNGFVYNEGGMVTSVDQPFIMRVSPNTPNDYTININVVVTAKNGLDDQDETIYEFGIDPRMFFTINVRNGVELPNMITEDMVLTNDKFYIIANATRIAEGVTVTVEEGTNIQFWSTKPEDPYAETPIAYLRVDGRLFLNGTAENPVKIYPSGLFDNFEVKIFRQNSGQIYMNYTEVQNPKINVSTISNSYFTQNQDIMMFRFLSGGNVYCSWTRPEIVASSIDSSIFWKLGGKTGSLYIDGYVTGSLFDSNYANIQFEGENNVFLNNFVRDMGYYQDQLYVSQGWVYYRNSDSNIDINKIFRDEETGTTYVQVSGLSRYEYAQRFARQLGGHLAVINTAKENDFIRRNISGQTNIGLWFANAVDGYQWINRDLLGYQNFSADDDNPNFSQYVSIRTDGFWYKSNSGSYLIEITGDIYVNDIVLDSAFLTLGLESLPYQVRYELLPITANHNDLEWYSMNENIATIDQNGVVTPHALGQTTLVIRSKDQVISKSISLSVIQTVPLENIKLVAQEQININQVYRLPYTLTPFNTTELSFNWSVDDSNIATVDQQGRLTTHRPGFVTVFVESPNGLIKDQITIKVVSPVLSLKFTNEYIITYVGSDPINTAILINPSDATNKTIVYQSANPNVAYVDEDGYLHAVSNGMAVIRATAQHTSVYTELTVTVTSESVANTKFIDIQTIGSPDYPRFYGLTQTGEVWHWGREGFSLPEQITQLSNIKEINSGYYDAVFLTHDGKAYRVRPVWGGNQITQLQLDFTNIKSVKNQSYDHNNNGYTLILREDGTVWGIGNNYNGELPGVYYEQASEYLQLDVSDVTQMLATYRASIYLKTDGKVYYSGHPNSSSVLSEIQGLTNITSIHRSETWDFGYTRVIATDIYHNQYHIDFSDSFPHVYKQNFQGINEPIIQYRFTGNHYVALGESGKVYTMGWNGYGQLGLGHTSSTYGNFQTVNLSNIQKIYATYYNTFALTNDGRIYVWGYNANYQVGDLTTINRLRPTQPLIGFTKDVQGPQITTHNLTQSFDINQDLIISFDEAIKAHTSIMSVRLIDENNNPVSIQRRVVLNQLIIDPVTPLVYGKSYSLIIAHQAVVDYFNNVNSYQMINFKTEEGITLNRTQYKLDINEGTTAITYDVNPKWTDPLVFTSNNLDVVEVDAFGIMTPKAIGTTTITIRNTQSTYEWIIAVEVIERIHITSLDITSQDVIMNAGSTQRVIIQVLPINYNEDVLWSSSDAAIASVDEFGFVKGLKNGTVTITATSLLGTYSDSIQVTVVEPVTEVKQMKLHEVVELSQGTIQVQAIVLPETATNKTLIWESANPNIASVDSNGLVTLHQAGEVIIRARAEHTTLFHDMYLVITELDLAAIKFVDVKTTHYGDALRTYALDDQGNVWHWGHAAEKYATKLNISNVVQMESSYHYAYFLTASGDLYRSYVYNNDQISTYNTGITNIKQFSMTDYGYDYFIILKEDGTVWGRGSNYNGELYGLTGNQINQFTQLPGLINIKQVVSLYGFNAFLTEDGRVLYSGQNMIGEISNLGHIVEIKRYSNDYDSGIQLIVKDNMNKYYTVNLYNADGTASSELESFQNVEGTVVSMEQNNSHTLVLNHLGHVYAKGNNYYGQLGLGTTSSNYVSAYGKVNLENVVKIFVHRNNSYAITTTGDLYIWGMNGYFSQVGNLTFKDEPTPQKLMIGYKRDTLNPQILSINPTHQSQNVSINQSIVIRFNEKIKSNNIANIRLYNSLNQQVSIETQLKINELIVKPVTALKYGEKYRLDVPAYTIVDHVNLPNEWFEVGFETESGIILDRTNFKIDIHDEPVEITYVVNEKWNEDIVFTSSNEGVATVNQQGVVTPQGLGLTEITIQNPSGSYKWKVYVEVVHRIPVTDISFADEQIFINTQTTRRLIPTITPIDYNEDIVWSSSDSSVASVDEFGFVTGHKDGTVTITAATVTGMVSHSLNVTVIEPVTHISVLEEFIVFNLNDDPIQVPVIIGPEGATNKNVIWETASPNIAYVDTQGYLHAVSKGTAIIRGTAEHTHLFVEIIVTITDEISHTTKFVDIQAMGYSSEVRIYALTDEGHVWYWGNGNAFLPQRIPNISNVKHISMSTHRGWFLTHDGKVYEVSMNGASNNIYLLNTGIDNITTVSTNSYNYPIDLIVKDDGTVWGRGYNYHGQLGEGLFTYTNNFIQLEGVLGMKSALALGHSSVMLGQDGKVYYLGGSANKKQLTQIQGLSNIVEIKRGGLDWDGHFNFVAQDSLGRFYRVDMNSSTPSPTMFTVLNQSELKDYAEQSGYFQLALTKEGKLYARGSNDYGQLGLGHTSYQSTYQKVDIDHVSKVFAFGQNALVITENGDIYIWGRNSSQQIGDLSSEHRLTPFKSMIGLSVDEEKPYIESQYPVHNQLHIPVDATIMIDFNEGVRAYQNYASIQLLDQNNRQVSIVKQLKLDKLYITPVTPLRFGENYTLILPAQSVMDYFMNTNNQSTLNFTTEQGVIFNRTQYRMDIHDEPLQLDYSVNAKWNQDLIFVSSNESVATVDEFGIITPISIGNTEIQVSSADGRYLWQLMVTVIERISITDLNITEESMTISKGVSQRINLMVTPSNYNEDILWTSSDPTVATIDEFGFVRGLKNGVVTVTATSRSGLYSDTILVTVIEPVTHVYFNDPEMVIYKNSDSKQLQVIILPETATNKEVEFISASPEIASITKEGLLTPVNTGIAVIRAMVKYSNLYADIIVTVTDVDVDSIKFIDVKTLGYGDYVRTYALTQTGDVWYWGRGTQTPKLMTNLNNIVRMDFSIHSGLMQKATGEVYRVTATTQNNNIEQIAAGITNITHISLQDYSVPHSLLVRSDGTVWGEGNNDFGQLAGIPFTSVNGYVQLEGLANIKQAIALYESSVYLTNGGRLYYSGNPNQKSGATLIPDLQDIVSIATYESYHSNQRMVIAKDSIGRYFKVSLAGNSIEVTSIDATLFGEAIIDYTETEDSHKLALTESGKVFAMGYNYHGQLGNNTRTNSYYNYVDTGLRNISKIMNARYNSYAITNEGKIYMWGFNSNNNLGNSRLPYYVIKPANILIGSTQPTHQPYITSVTSENGGEIKIDGQIVIDFSEAVQVQYNYANLKLYDGSGNQVSIQKMHVFDKIYIQSMTPLLYGHTYTLSIPHTTVTNYFGYANNGDTYTFTTEKGVDFTRTNYRIDINDEPVQVAYNLHPDWNTPLLFESLNTNVITVNAQGIVTPVGMGVATLKVYTEDLKYVWLINFEVIHRIYITSMDIQESSMVIQKDQTERIRILVSPSNYNEDIIWTSSDPSVATVDEYGFVKGKMNGATIITATSLSGQYSDSVSVQVIEPVTSIVYDQYMVMMTVEDQPLQIDVEVLPVTATNKNIIWRSSNNNVAYFDGNGKLVPVNIGTIIIRAQAEHSTVYKDIIVSITESAMAQPTIIDVTSLYYNNKTAVFALQSDGSVWTWGQGALGRGIWEDDVTTPRKLEISGVKSMHSNNSETWVRRVSFIKQDGTVWSIGSYYSAGNGSWESQTFTKANYLNNIIDVSLGYHHTLALKDDGTVWSWGHNGSYQLGDGTNQDRSMPIQVNGIENAKQILANNNSSYVLTENGTLYAFGYNNTYSTPKVVNLPGSMRIKQLIQRPNDDSIFWLTENNEVYSYHITSTAPYRYFQQITNSHVVSEMYFGNGYQVFKTIEGKHYAFGNNQLGQLGNGQNFINNGEANPSLIALNSISKIKVGYNNAIAITSEGKLNIWGDNASGQLADFSKVNNFTPREVYFGAESDSIAPTRVSTVPSWNQTDVSLDTQIRIKFNEAIRQSINFSTIYLLDANDHIVSTQKTIDWDTLILTPTNPLQPNMSYRVQMEHNAVTDFFSNPASDYTYYFLTESISEGQNTEIPTRHYWTQSEIQAYFQTYVLEGHNSTFYNNAILNNLYDLDVRNWLRFFTNEGDQTYVFSNNYWGTSDPDLVGKQVVDFNDYQQYAHIKVTPFLTEGNAMMYPFITKVNISNDSESNMRIVGAETITVTISFNRSMDMNVPLKVFFGPDYPFTDYEVQGQWIDQKTWQGTYTITPLTGDGKQYFRIRDAVAADNPFLWMGDDDGRFMFEIRSFGAEAMNLQATGGEGSIELSWMQDEFDTLAGYNIYRSADLNGTYEKINSVLITTETNSYIDYNVLPGQPYFYKFTIVKTDLTESKFSNIAFAAAYDIIPPQLFHTPIFTANVGQEIQIFATAIDNIGIKSAKLFYRNISEDTYKEVEMILGTNNRYTGKIPASHAQIPGIAYYIEVSDGRSSVAHGSAATPNIVDIKDNPTVVTISPNKGIYQGNSSVVISGINFKPGAKVYFSHLEGLNVVVEDENTIKVKTPAFSPGRVNVKVVNPDGSSHTLYNAFEYYNDDVRIVISNGTVSKGSEFQIPVRVENAQGLVAMDLTIGYDATVLTFVSATKSALTGRFNLAMNSNQTNKVLISMASDTSISGSGDILMLKFQAKTAIAATSTQITIDSVNINSINDGIGIQNGTITFSTVYSFSGTVFYYFNNNVVPGVKVELRSPLALYSATTPMDGTFSFSGIVSDDYELKAFKENQLDAITAYDASLILQHAVQLTSLTNNQKIAADVNSDGAINSMDASMILQYVAGMRTIPFEGTSSAWKFVYPQASYPGLNRNYSSQSIQAILIGDVSGNYSTTSAQNQSTQGVIKAGQMRSHETGLTVPVSLDYFKYDLYSFETTIEIEQGVSVGEIRLSSELQNAYYIVNKNQAGYIRIAVASATPLNLQNPILEIDLITTQQLDKVSVRFTQTLFNEFSQIAQLQNIYRYQLNFDFNQDGIVNDQDILIFIKHYNKTYLYEDISFFDINRDGVVDIYDVIAARNHR